MHDEKQISVCHIGKWVMRLETSTSTNTVREYQWDTNKMWRLSN